MKIPSGAEPLGVPGVGVAQRQHGGSRTNHREEGPSAKPPPQVGLRLITQIPKASDQQN